MDLRSVGNNFGNVLPTATSQIGPAKSESHRVDDFKDAFVTVSPGEEKDLRGALEALMGNKTNLVEEAKTKQYADSYGQITNMCLMMSDDYVQGKMRSQMLDAYQVMFKNMEPDTKFTIVVNSDRDLRDVQKAMKDSNMENPERVTFVRPDGGGLTVWARDMMVCGFNPEEDRSVIIQPNPLHYWHGNDGVVPEYIAKAQPQIELIKQPKMITDGGDVMANTKESFVGNYSFAATAEKLGRVVTRDEGLRDRVVQYYENTFGKSVVKSESPDAIFPYKFEVAAFPKEVHRFNFKMVDNPDYKEPALRSRNEVSESKMYEDLALKVYEDAFGKPVTVLGKDDPSTAHKEEPATDHMDMGLTAVDDKTFFLGDPSLVKKAFEKMSPDRLHEVQDIFSEWMGRPVDLEAYVESDRNRDNPEDFKAYEKTLSGKGYNVVRIPHSEPKFGGPYLSYDNCVMERFEKDGQEFRRVFLPVYGVKELDNMAINAYKDQGFEVFPLPLDGLASRWGAIRCSTNWLERSPKG